MKQAHWIKRSRANQKPKKPILHPALRRKLKRTPMTGLQLQLIIDHAKLSKEAAAAIFADNDPILLMSALGELSMPLPKKVEERATAFLFNFSQALGNLQRRIMPKEDGSRETPLMIYYTDLADGPPGVHRADLEYFNALCGFASILMPLSIIIEFNAGQFKAWRLARSVDGDIPADDMHSREDWAKEVAAARVLVRADGRPTLLTAAGEPIQ